MSAALPTPLANLNEITAAIIGAAYVVSNELGAGFLEKVYENALRVELEEIGLNVECQHEIQIRYRNQVVGQYVADMVIEGKVLLELKAVSAIDDIHRAQCINYLRATKLPLCLLINFGRPKVEIVRLAGKK
jgi:GxxExxY protein